MEIRIMEKDGVLKVSAFGLRGQELAVYTEVGGFTLEVRHVLEDDEPVVAVEEDKSVVVEEDRAVVVEEDRPIVAPPEEAESTPYIKEEARDNPLFRKLAYLRRDLAIEDKLPPYMVFHDKTLLLMVEQKPVDLDALSRISGVGQAKLKKYGAAFLQAINGVAV
jgi:ATP-dependent DNA helicase RecQ